MKKHALLIAVLVCMLPGLCMARGGPKQYADIHFYLQRHGPVAGYIIYGRDTLRGTLSVRPQLFLHIHELIVTPAGGIARHYDLRDRSLHTVSINDSNGAM